MSSGQRTRGGILDPDLTNLTALIYVTYTRGCGKAEEDSPEVVVARLGRARRRRRPCLSLPCRRLRHGHAACHCGVLGDGDQRRFPRRRPRRRPPTPLLRGTAALLRHSRRGVVRRRRRGRPASAPPDDEGEELHAWCVLFPCLFFPLLLYR
jgi:hypothetical protein